MAQTFRPGRSLASTAGSSWVALARACDFEVAYGGGSCFQQGLRSSSQRRWHRRGRQVAERSCSAPLGCIERHVGQASSQTRHVYACARCSLDVQPPGQPGTARKCASRLRMCRPEGPDGSHERALHGQRGIYNVCCATGHNYFATGQHMTQSTSSLLSTR